jgi:hypothetical protein
MTIKYLVILIFLFYIILCIIFNNNKNNKTNTIKKNVSFADENNKPLKTLIKIIN